MPPLSVLDLSPVTTGDAGRAGVAQQPRSCASRRCARLSRATGSPSITICEYRKLRARHHDRPDRGDHAAHARRLRRRDAAQPCAAHGCRALQGAGGAVSRAHRSRHRARARHRSDHIGRAAAAAGYPRRRRFSRTLQEMLLHREQGLSGKPSVLESARDAVRRCACRRSFCSDRAITARSSPPRSVRDFPSRIISRATTRRRRCAPIATISSLRKMLAKPYAILAVAAMCADDAQEAERIAATADLNIVRRAKGDYLPLESPDAALSLSLYADRSRTHRA